MNNEDYKENVINNKITFADLDTALEILSYNIAQYAKIEKKNNKILKKLKKLREYKERVYNGEALAIREVIQKYGITKKIVNNKIEVKKSMLDDEKKKYKLTEEEHMRIYHIIEEEVFNENIHPDENPLAVIVGAQPGAGKGSVMGYSKREISSQGKDVVIISTDDYKPYHPNAKKLAKENPTDYVEIIEQDAGAWTEKILKKATEEKYNFIFEGTLKNDRILHRIEELKEKGFKVIVRTLAVPKMESLLGIHERYENEIESTGQGRLISINHHNEAFNGVPTVIDKIERSGLCTVEVWKRGEEINNPKLIYTSENKTEACPSARIALEQCRIQESRKTERTAQERIKKLKNRFLKRGAIEEEMKQLGELEKYIDENTREIGDY